MPWSPPNVSNQQKIVRSIDTCLSIQVKGSNGQDRPFTERVYEGSVPHSLIILIKRPAKAHPSISTCKSSTMPRARWLTYNTVHLWKYVYTDAMYAETCQYCMLRYLWRLRRLKSKNESRSNPEYTAWVGLMLLLMSVCSREAAHATNGDWQVRSYLLL